MWGGGEQVPVVRPDFRLAVFGSGCEMHGISGPEEDAGGKVTDEKTGAAQQTFGDRYEPPHIILDVPQKGVQKTLRLRSTQNTFSHVAMEHAGHFRNYPGR